MAHFVPTFMVGNLWELRIFNEILPWGATCVVWVARTLLNPTNEQVPADVSQIEEVSTDPRNASRK